MTSTIILTIISTVLFLGLISATYTAAYYKKKAWKYLNTIDRLLDEYRGIVRESLSLANSIDKLEAKLKEKEEQSESNDTDNAD